VPYLSALEVRSRRGAIQIHVYLYLYLYLTNHTCLYSPDARHYRPVVCTHCAYILTKGWPGWVDVGGWSHTEI